MARAEWAGCDHDPARTCQDVEIPNVYGVIYLPSLVSSCTGLNSYWTMIDNGDSTCNEKLLIIGRAESRL